MLKLVAVLCLVAFANAQTKNLVDLAKELGATTLVSFLEAADLNETIATGGPFTVFGPTNDAFSALPADLVAKLQGNKTLLQSVLKYHVINGKVMSNQLTNEQTVDTLNTGTKVRVNIYQKNPTVITITGSKVATADQEATNGVIHVLDKVMLPPTGNIVDYVSTNADYSTLLNAVTAAGLGSTLAGAGPFTLFAPNNAAFAKIPKEDLDKLLADKPKLTDVLKYHVVSGTNYAVALSNGQKIPTLEGKSVQVKIDNNGVMIDQSKVISADVSVTNGVIHVVDTVMMPPTTSGAATLSTSFALILAAFAITFFRS